MKKLLLIIPFLFLTSCATVCTVEKSAEVIVAGQIATALKCKRGDLVLASVTKFMSKVNFCAPPAARGFIATSLCGSVVSLGVIELNSMIPTEWECDTSGAQSGVSVALTSACQMLPF